MRSTRYAAIAAALAIGAVQLPAAASSPEAGEAVGFNPHGFKFPAGVYRCELNRSVHVREVAPDMQSAVVNWNKRDYTLRAVNARSGALRYEDPASGLVWLVILEKSMLLDTRQGKQLANECKV